MGTVIDVNSIGASFGIGALWVCKAAIAVTAVAWGMSTLPVFWHDAPLARVAARVVENETFKSEALVALLPAVDAVEQARRCRAPALHSAAVIRLAAAADVLDGAERTRIDGSLAALREAARASLGCSPDDAFVWLTLFWVENTIDGFSEDHLAYLRMSYITGPNEGWIALKRNRVAIALFDALTPDLKEFAINEFVHLIESGFMSQAVSIFLGPGWHNKDVLLPRLEPIALERRQAFARAIANEGFDVEVPGIRRVVQRPWR
jgi:hypothetical protein